MPAQVVIACMNKVWKKDRPRPYSDNPVLNEAREICERENRKSSIIIRSVVNSSAEKVMQVFQVARCM